MMTGKRPARLVMMGPPGAGKGTQAERFAKARGVPKISTGDILREAIEEGHELGKAAKIVMDAGHLIGDDIMISIVDERLTQDDARRGFVLDGFPRTVTQAEALDQMVDDGVPLIVVDIEVPDETLVRRLGARRICRACGTTAEPGAATCHKCGGALVQRRDDIESVVRERLGVYTRETQPLVQYYRRRPTFQSVDGDQTPDAVAADITAAVAAAARELG